MQEIDIHVCGDYWINPQDLEENYHQAPLKTPILLRINSEGPSLGALGVVTAVERLCGTNNRWPGSVCVADWHNAVEQVPFARVTQNLLSHFFWMSDAYRDLPYLEPTDEYLFACFVGRATLPRARMLYDLQKFHRDRTLLSLMNLSGMHGPLQTNLETYREWSQQTDPKSFEHWRSHCEIISIDDHAVRDQYVPDAQTNIELVRDQYHRFLIEIVSETYTRGQTFFPTEKTVRPLVRGRGFLIYGPNGFLGHLRDLGFRTFHTLWDETYDHLQGYARWQAIRDLLPDIAKIDKKDLSREIATIHQHNLQTLDGLLNRYRPH